MSSQTNTRQPGAAYDAVGLVEDLLDKAAAADASDIHFERIDGRMLIRFRLDGVLKTVETVPAAIAETRICG